MIWRLSEGIWFGDKPSPVEAVGLGVRSVICVASSIRQPYWSDLGRLPWDVWYFRMGCPDRVDPGREYFRALESVVEAIVGAGRFPLLCHCRCGGHRGPTVAAFAYWVRQGRDRMSMPTALVMANAARPGACGDNPNRVYRRAAVKYCEDRSHELGVSR